MARYGHNRAPPTRVSIVQGSPRFRATLPLPPPAKPKRHQFPRGNSFGGRKPNATNKVPTLLKECIMQAAILEGSDGKGKDGLIGFLRKLSKKDLRSFAGLLGRVLPLQIENEKDEQVEVTYRSVAEVRRELLSRGITMELMTKILHEPPTIEHEAGGTNDNPA